jgi:hypothetical protein
MSPLVTLGEAAPGKMDFSNVIRSCAGNGVVRYSF